MEEVGEALFAAMEADGGMEWIALQNGRFELRGSVSKDALARAAIEALREPDEAMEKAAMNAIPGGHGQAWIYAGDAYRAAIATILSDPTPRQD